MPNIRRINKMSFGEISYNSYTASCSMNAQKKSVQNTAYNAKDAINAMCSQFNGSGFGTDWRLGEFMPKEEASPTQIIIPPIKPNITASVKLINLEPRLVLAIATYHAMRYAKVK